MTKGGFSSGFYYLKAMFKEKSLTAGLFFFKNILLLQCRSIYIYIYTHTSDIGAKLLKT